MHQECQPFHWLFPTPQPYPFSPALVFYALYNTSSGAGYGTKRDSLRESMAIGTTSNIRLWKD
jgi:hypothetical protein